MILYFLLTRKFFLFLEVNDDFRHTGLVSCNFSFLTLIFREELKDLYDRETNALGDQTDETYTELKSFLNEFHKTTFPTSQQFIYS